MTENELLREIKKVEKDLKAYSDFQSIIEEAINDFIKKRYAKLFLALEKYATPTKTMEARFEEIREAWGQGFIGDRKFKSLDDLFKQYENDGLARCVDEVLFMFDRKISDKERYLHELNKQKGWLKKE